MGGASGAERAELRLARSKMAAAGLRRLTPTCRRAASPPASLSVAETPGRAGAPLTWA